mgnify:FL=1
MIQVLSCPLPNGGMSVIKTANICGVTSEECSSECRVYVSGWATEGITIDLPIDEFAKMWMSALLDLEEDSLEYDIIFAPDAMH